MAIYNEILEGRYNRALQKLLSMKGRPPTPQLAGEIVPSIPFFWGREMRYLEDWRMYGATITTSAVAAQNSVCRLTNSLGSKVIIIVESISMFVSVASGFAIEDTVVPGATTNLPTTTTAAGFEARFNPLATGTGGAVGVLSAGNNVAQGARVTWFQGQLQAINTDHAELINYENQEIPLLPGTDMQFRAFVNNLQFTVNVRWRERPLGDSELF